jgi:hypothetical protein
METEGLERGCGDLYEIPPRHRRELRRIAQELPWVGEMLAKCERDGGLTAEEVEQLERLRGDRLGCNNYD